MGLPKEQIKVGHTYVGGKQRYQRFVHEIERDVDDLHEDMVWYSSDDRYTPDEVLLSSFARWATEDITDTVYDAPEPVDLANGELEDHTVGTTAVYVTKQDIEPAVSQSRLRREHVTWIGGDDETDDIRPGDAFVDTDGKLWITIKDTDGMLDLVDPVTMECDPHVPDDEGGPCFLRRVRLHAQLVASPWKGDL